MIGSSDRFERQMGDRAIATARTSDSVNEMSSSLAMPSWDVSAADPWGRASLIRT